MKEETAPQRLIICSKESRLSLSVARMNASFARSMPTEDGVKVT